MQQPSKLANQARNWRRWVVIGVALLAALLFFLRSGKQTGAEAVTFAARRGPLPITVSEGGSLQALESQEAKCEVRVGYQGTKILKIVEEGYLVTEEDVKTNKVLVELDSSDIEKQILTQEVQYQSAVANLADAEQNFEIQLNQNQSDVKAAEQKTRFARMDFDKFLGDAATAEIIIQLGLDKLLAAATTNDVAQAVRTISAAVPPTATSERKTPAITAPDKLALNAAAKPNPPDSASRPAVAQAPAPVPGSDHPMELPKIPLFEMPKTLIVDFSKYAKIEVLGDGEAKQKLRKFEDDLQVAQKELGQSTATLEGTRRLFDKGFVTKTDLQRDEIANENSRLKVQTAGTARDLFLKYEFPKLAEEALSKYAESVRELDKARRVAASRIAQADAKLKSAQGQYQVQFKQRNDLQDQLAKCTIRAKKSGLLVYGSGRDDYEYGREPIREGATIRERQTIFTIPDMTRLVVKVKIHESYIKKVKKGQKASITVDAFPDKVLEGEVTMVGLLPDSQNRWLDPDMKVYLTTITLAGTHDWLKPGMSAEVEILVDRLADVVYVPVQAVSPSDGKRVCFIANGRKAERREVEIGQFNDEFIEIQNGLKEAERVLLRSMEGSAEKEGEKQPKPPQTEKAAKEKAAPAATPPTAPPRKG